MRLHNYRAQIDSLINGRAQQESMLNGSEAHAAIIIERMFANAEREMRILTRRLDPTIYADEEVLAQVESFASDPETVTNIIVEDISPESLSVHRLVKLANALPNVHIHRLPTDLSNQIGFNYSVMDRAGYRFEDDKTKVNAIVRFNNDPSFTNDAADYFDSLLKASPSVFSEEGVVVA